MSMVTSGPNSILPLRLGTQTTYLIPARDGYVLVDGGNRGYGSVFARKLARLGIRPERIKLMILTHVHFDHVGSAASIRELTGCEVAVQAKEAPLLESGRAVIPPGTNGYGRLFSRLAIGWGTHHFDFPGLQPDLALDGEFDLSGYGLRGRVLPTPGHTAGSVSVVLDSGRAFVGDAVIRYLPFMRPLLPPFGNDKKRMIKTWKTLIETGADVFYPGHGWPFSAKELSVAYDRILARMGGGPFP